MSLEKIIFFCYYSAQKVVVYMFYPLNRDLKRVFSEFFFLRSFCVSYFVLYLLFIFVFHLTYAWSMAISFVIVVVLMVIYVFCHKRKMKTTLDHLWMSETEIKIEKVSKILDLSLIHI